MTRRVVATGMGVISPLGNDLPTTWAEIIAGHSGLGPITHFDTTGFKTTIAGEVKNYEVTRYFAAKEARRMDLFAQYALIAAREALQDAQMVFDDGLMRRTAVIIGSGSGGIGTD
jgi:3-oxoacyl-[acyl-carrier-protein] synthase II